MIEEKLKYQNYSSYFEFQNDFNKLKDDFEVFSKSFNHIFIEFKYVSCFSLFSLKFNRKTVQKVLIKMNISRRFQRKSTIWPLSIFLVNLRTFLTSKPAD